MADSSTTRIILTEEERRERNRIRCREYYHRNKEARSAAMAAYRAADPERTKRQDRGNYLKNKAGTDYHARRYARLDKEKAKADLAAWKDANPDKVRAIEVARNERVKAKAATDPEFREKLRKKSREWRQKKRDEDPDFKKKSYEATRKWRSENPEWSRKYGKIQRARKKDDPNFKIMASIRARLNKSLKGVSKSKRTAELVGASIDVVRAHIESQFIDGMNWENWGRGWHGAQEWHLDHIRPLSSFDLTDPDQLAAACHYTNLQPLWSKDNLKKGARYEF